jgi:hypothetical protein
MNKSDQPESTDNPQVKAPTEPLNHARRRLSKVALAAPVIASLAARPALACSVSGFMSGNTSPGREDPRCEGYGCTPGFWKNNPEAWRVYSPGHCSSHNPGNGKCQAWTSGGTTLKDILTCSNPFTQVDLSDYLLDIMVKAIDGGGRITTQYADVCHYIAAILNAAASEVSYGSSVAEIQAGLCKAVTDGKVNYYTTVLLAGLNDRGCVFDAHGNCEKNFVAHSSGGCIPACPAGQTYNPLTLQCEANTTP